MRVNRILSPLTALGPGRRVGLWVQGCSLACRGCASLDTWDRSAGTGIEVAQVVEELSSVIRREQLTGLTVTGGEPFQQPDAVTQVIAGVREQAMGTGAPDQLDVLIFTGYSAAAAQRRAPDLLSSADALVCGRYEQQSPGADPLRASANQELLIRTPLGSRRFADLSSVPTLQVSAVDGDLLLVGLPRPGDLDLFTASLAQRGVALEGVSWRP